MESREPDEHLEASGNECRLGVAYGGVAQPQSSSQLRKTQISTLNALLRR